MQHLRPRRAHPRSLARRHDHDVQHHAAYPLASGRRGRPPIIAALLAVAVAARRLRHGVRLGYGQGPSLAFRWLDGYVEFDDAQSLQASAPALDDCFAWHRRTQLPDYAELLARAQAELPADGHAGAHVRLEPGDAGPDRHRRCERAVPTIAEVVPTLSPAAARPASRSSTPSRTRSTATIPAARPGEAPEAPRPSARSSAPRCFYGRLDEAQRELRRPLDRRIAVRRPSSPTPSGCAASRTCSRCAPAGRERAAPAEARGRGPRLAAKRSQRSPRESYRRYAERSSTHNCAYAARLHNATTAEQRRERRRSSRATRTTCARSSATARRLRPAPAGLAHCTAVSGGVSTFTRCGLVGLPAGSPAARRVNIAGSTARSPGRHAFALGARFVERLAALLVADQDRDLALVVTGSRSSRDPRRRSVRGPQYGPQYGRP